MPRRPLAALLLAPNLAPSATLAAALVATTVVTAVAAVAAVAAIVAAGQLVPATAAPRESDVAAAPLNDVPADWTRVDTGPFSVALPPGWRYEKLQGEDSFVGQFVGDGIALTFDLGAFWNSPPRDASGHDVTNERVDFRAAQVFRPRDPKDVLGLFIEHTDDFGALGGPKHLSIVGTGVALEDHVRVLQIFRSVRFRRLIGDGGRWERVEPPAGEVSLLDLDVLHGSEPWFVGARHDESNPSSAVFRRTPTGWEETPLPDAWGAIGILAVAGDWAISPVTVFRYDNVSDRWKFDIENVSQFAVYDVAIDGRSDEQGWVLGGDRVIRLASGHASEADGGWGKAGGRSVDVLSRSSIARGSQKQASEAMAVGWLSASLFDGRTWKAMAWDPHDFANFDGFGVDLVAADEAWFVGGSPKEPKFGAFHHRVGDTITATMDSASNVLFAIDLLSPAEGWAVGGSYSGEDPGELWRVRDGVWERQPPPCNCNLTAVQAQPNGEAWAVGYTDVNDRRRGVVLHYVPAAPPATPDASPTAVATESATPPSTATQRATGGRVSMPWLGRDHTRR